MVLGPSTPRVTFMLSDTREIASPVAFTLWATTCNDMVYTESPKAIVVTPPPTRTISVTVTNDVLDTIHIMGPGWAGPICSGQATCSSSYPDGTDYAGVQLMNAGPFQYDCGDGVPREAGSGSDGICGFEGVGSAPLTSDHTVTVTLK